jgi:hypothetical protein
MDRRPGANLVRKRARARSDGRGPWVSGLKREREILGAGRLPGRAHRSGSTSTSTGVRRERHGRSRRLRVGREVHGAMAIGWRAPTRRRGDVAGDHRRLLNGAERTEEREREVRWGNSPWVKRRRQRSSVRRWQVATMNDGWALPGGI